MSDLEVDPMSLEALDLLERVYQEFLKRGDAPQCLRDFIYETLGRILP